MKNDTNNGLVGAALIGLGCGLTAIGIALVIPAWTTWSLGLVEQAMKKGKEGISSGVETAANLAGEIHGRAYKKFDEASKTIRNMASKTGESAEKSREYAS